MRNSGCRILLVNPPFVAYQPTKYELVFPLGLAYLSASLKQQGFSNVAGLDCVTHAHSKRIGRYFRIGMERSDIKKAIENYSPDIVGITCSFTKRFPYVLEIADIVKQVDPGTIVIVGGIYPSAEYKEVEKYPSIDYVATGEGENILPTMLGSKHRYENINEIPYPDYELFPFENYVKSGRVSIITSRGCPFDCSFCSVHCVWGSQWRARSVDNVIGEIRYLVDTYGIDHISFDDDNFSLDKERTLAICKALTPLKIKWNTPNGVYIETLSRPLLEAMKESGCHALNLAVESGDEHILHDVIGKKLSLNKVREVVRWCRELGIKTLAYFVIGMPGETLASMQRSLDFAKECLFDAINVFIATPYHGSKLYHQCLQNGWLRKSDLQDFNSFEPLIETPWLSSQDIKYFMVKFNADYESYHDAYSKQTMQECKREIRNQ